jgi:hypothetical protein
VLLLAGVLSAAPAWAAQELVLWDGGAGTSNWGDAPNWSGNVVPNNGTPSGTTYAVFIDPGGDFTVDLNVDVFVDHLAVGAGDRLNINDGRMITVVNSGVGTGTIENAGLIVLDSVGADTTLRISGGPVVLSGGGGVQMSNSHSNQIQSVAATDQLINVDNIIVGSGQIGLGSMAFHNHGTVLANQPRALFINPAVSRPVVNTGTMRASAGATLRLENGTYANDGGLIEVDSSVLASHLDASGATITGGTVQLVGANKASLSLLSSSIIDGVLSINSTGVVYIFGSSRLGGTVVNAVGGRISIGLFGPGPGELVLEAGGVYQNSGYIVFEPSSIMPPTLRVAGGTVTLNGGGYVAMLGNPSSRILGTAPGDQLVNADNVIFGGGEIGVGSMRFTNQGTLIANQGNALTLDTSDGMIHNMGTVRMAEAGVLNLGTGDTYAQTSGATIVDGTLNAPGGGRVDIGGGALRGNGMIFSLAVSNIGDAAPGTSPGLLSIAGSYSQSAAGALTIEIGGATVRDQYDRLEMTGPAFLGGRLGVTLINGFTPAPGQVFPILTAAGISGTFAGLPDGALLLMPDGTIFIVRYSPAGAPTSVTLTTFGCSTPVVVVVPDGRLTGGTLGAGAEMWFGASLRLGNSYSVEFNNASGDSTPPGTLTLFSGDDGCVGTSTMTARDTEHIDPGSHAASRRKSFVAAGTGTFFRARLDNAAGPAMPLSFSWSDTTQFSPAWSTFATFDTYYSFQNTTGETIAGTLTLLDSSGAELSTFAVSIPTGDTVSVNTASLGVSRNQTGTGKLTHDGPPGAVLAEAVIANFNISPAYVQPVKFQAVRDGR